jgi:hypothetical protein
MLSKVSIADIVYSNVGASLGRKGYPTSSIRTIPLVEMLHFAAIGMLGTFLREKRRINKTRLVRLGSGG